MFHARSRPASYLALSFLLAAIGPAACSAQSGDPPDPAADPRTTTGSEALTTPNTVVPCDPYLEQITAALGPPFTAAVNANSAAFLAAIQKSPDYTTSGSEEPTSFTTLQWNFSTHFSQVNDFPHVTSTTFAWDASSGQLTARLAFQGSLSIPWSVGLGIDTGVGALAEGSATGNIAVSQISLALTLQPDGTFQVPVPVVGYSVNTTGQFIYFDPGVEELIERAFGPFAQVIIDVSNSAAEVILSNVAPGIISGQVSGKLNDYLGDTVGPAISGIVNDATAPYGNALKLAYLYCVSKPTDVYTECGSGFCQPSACTSGANCFKNDRSCGGTCPAPPSCSTIGDQGTCSAARCLWIPRSSQCEGPGLCYLNQQCLPPCHTVSSPGFCTNP